MRYFTSDWHLGATYERINIFGRTYGSEDLILRDYTSIFMDEEDEFHFLGDLFDSTLENINNFDLNVFKFRLKHTNAYMYRGNHDRRFSDEFFKELGFREVYAEGHSAIVGDYELNHYPTRLGYFDNFGLCGHIHGAWKVQKNMLNVGVDTNHFRIYSETDVEFYRTAIELYYDDDVWCGDHHTNQRNSNRGKSGSYFNVKSGN